MNEKYAPLKKTAREYNLDKVSHTYQTCEVMEEVFNEPDLEEKGKGGAEILSIYITDIG